MVVVVTMTLHIVTITPNHVISVSDRMISTSRGHVEVDDDRFKHVTLQTEDARVVISFAGFAGILGRDGKLTETMVDWLTGVLRDTMEAGYHGIDRHLTDIRDQANRYIGNLKTRYPRLDLRLAILVSGWIGPDAFNCVIDNCLEGRWTWAKNARDSFKVRVRNYRGAKFEDGSYIAFLGDERLGLKQRSLLTLLHLRARQEDINGIFDASVQIIRAASAISNGTIGEKCSFIHIPRDVPLFEARHDRLDPGIWTVYPNFVINTPHLKLVHWNDEVHRPKPAANLVHLVTPAQADTLRKKLAFWHRALEKLRLLHNEQGAKVRNSNSETELDRFHQWQREQFEPVEKAALNELELVKSQLKAEDPATYGYRVGKPVDPFLALKKNDRVDTIWDDFINLSDVKLFRSDS